MRIAFDLDGTLVPMGDDFATEPTAAPWRWLTHDPLRHGTRALLRELRARGHTLWVYTSSFRSTAMIRALLLGHGAWLDGVVNGHHHDELFRSRPPVTGPCQKHPPSFGIELLVDDSELVAWQGERHGFHVLLLRQDDEGWVQTVLRASG